MQAVRARLRSDAMILPMCSSETASLLATQEKAMLTFWAAEQPQNSAIL